ncbi:hypothetical protein SETIT_1G264700v2 [Setaria italica]|uniref:RNase H type-1 domain-containing protein n=1 Tax=Setaria italica TaxID=4555 RepID=A0A368PRQ9_SETIT|nr:hypothetical protein SETIT_1G264700v2 [Setaria italica]
MAKILRFFSKRKREDSLPIRKEKSKSRWSPPRDLVKVNVDGSFVPQTGEAGVGVIAVLFHCASAVEAKARACVEGIRLAGEWTPGSVISEMDCAQINQASRSREDRSQIVLVKRECNMIANDLAQLARRTCHSAVWLGCAPTCVIGLVEQDCNLMSPS